MALTYVAASGLNYSSQNGTSLNTALPTGWAVGDLLVIVVGLKPNIAEAGNISSTPTGWTKPFSQQRGGGYGTTLAADTGTTTLVYLYKTAESGETAPTLTLTTSTNVSWSIMLAFRADSGLYETEFGFGGDTTAGAFSATLNGPLNVTAGDIVQWSFCIPTDVSTPSQFSAPTYSQAGISASTSVEIIEPDSGTGMDIGGLVSYTHSISGTATDVPTVSATTGGTTTNVRGPVVAMRIREGVAFSPLSNATWGFIPI